MSAATAQAKPRSHATTTPFTGRTRLFAWLRQARHDWRTRSVVQNLDDRMLRDIGLQRIAPSGLIVTM